jgi:hypothetical protein
VRVLDTRNGKPVKDVWVELQYLDEGRKLKGLSSGQTNPHGLVAFYLPDPSFETITLESNSESPGLCSETEFLAERILRDGAIGKNTCGCHGFKYSASPEPGELVIFEKHRSLYVTFWEKLFQKVVIFH